ncbi:YihY/virulence factor BrkB family protein [Phenylobacterium sp.]|uniref:YihY/virulence factor BrkB family protein n=1 Tax=Phenylobacterium sp. TaxID=1871053 RepID=UPI00301D66B3
MRSGASENPSAGDAVARSSLGGQPPAEAVDFDEQEPGRGRAAAHPLHIPWRGWRDIVWRVSREFGEDKLTVVAGGVTYFTLLAIFPALGVFVSLYGLIADVGAVQAQLAQLSVIFPPEAVSLLGDQMMRLASGQAASLSLAFLVSLLLSLWSAGAGIRALVDGLNVAYDEAERRPYLLRTAVTYAFTLVLLVFLAAISVILVAAPIVLAWFGIREGLLVAARWPLVFVVAAGCFAVAYRYGPSRKPARWRWIAPGAFAAAALWIAGSAGFSWYLNHVARLDATYGSLGAAIAFMLWVWVSVLIVLLGAELNAEIEHQTAQDSTVGPPKPMGQRGAAVADEVGGGFMGLRAGADHVRDLARRFRPTRLRGRPAAPPGPRR